MDYIVNENIKIIAETKTKQQAKELQATLNKANINAYSKALRKIGVKGGSR